MKSKTASPEVDDLPALKVLQRARAEGKGIAASLEVPGLVKGRHGLLWNHWTDRNQRPDVD